MVTISALTILFQLFIFLNPNASIAVDGESVPYSYLWKSGLVWLYIYGAIILNYASYLMLRRKKHSRTICLLGWGTFLLWTGILNAIPMTEMFGILFFYCCFFWLYFYKRKPVVEYFSKAV
ncbi:MAG: hypothetical protein PVJ01_07390, partial [Pseudomonadota bacterium]|jgi:hypothetical protein